MKKYINQLLFIIICNLSMRFKIRDLFCFFLLEKKETELTSILNHLIYLTRTQITSL